MQKQAKNSGLASSILRELEKKPKQKAVDLARALNVERREVDLCLASTLAGKVVQDSVYRWSLLKKTTPSPTSTPTPAPGSDNTSKPATEIRRLCEYYLESIGPDASAGVHTLAASKFGSLDYAELPRLPQTEPDWPWWNSQGVGNILGKVKASSASTVAWLGYPTRLREHRRQVFYVEPVLLWQIRIPEKAGEPYRFTDDLPVPNFSVLRAMAMGDTSAIFDEAARLDEELGLNNPSEDRPEMDELVERLVSIRPDWDWQEAMRPEDCSVSVALSDINKTGIYNRAIVLSGERSPFTKGLETELRLLGDVAEPVLAGTALGRMLSGELNRGEIKDERPLIEVLPMNTEQRAAVLSALTAQHTVITGPPGTGKSQIVTNLLINAAWREMKVLFASRNNKAVDVVEARINALGNRPVLLRLGANEYQARLGSYMSAMLSGQPGPDDQASYDDGLARHERLSQRQRKLSGFQSQTLQARNTVDRLEADIEDFREIFGNERFHALSKSLLDAGSNHLLQLAAATDAIDVEKMGVIGRLVFTFTRATRMTALQEAIGRVLPVAEHLGVAPVSADDQGSVHQVRLWQNQISERLACARKVLEYQSALDLLRSNLSFEDIARQKHELSDRIADNSERLWRDWVQLAPGRLSVEQRKDINDFASLLPVMTANDAKAIPAAVKAKLGSLQAKVSLIFSCWAVTSLSARGRVPFEPGLFDLVVIDEASQCDIASALPLLYRAKRSVIIGDPMQLRHISALNPVKDTDFLVKHDLLENRSRWMYSTTSLYDLGAGLADPAQIINLRDHHRSHADIIEFSNQAFYGGKLRVATRYTHLKRPKNQEPGVIWQDVRGLTVRPANGGALNNAEADAIVKALEDLLVRRDYKGSVGVVTPFRAQAQLIQTLIARVPSLLEPAGRAELLVDTVHRFQGDERDVMFFSPVVSEGAKPGALAFLRSNDNLFNVAITRARGLLHVVGDRKAATNSGIHYLEEFARYVSGLGAEPGVGPVAPVPLAGPDYPSVSRPELVSEWERVFYRALYAAGIRSMIPQFTVEQYILDFAIIEGDRRLNIEIDGERYHRSWTGELVLRDQLRNQRLIELGWEVKRFWVYEIRDRLPECVHFVSEWLDRSKKEVAT